MRNKKERRRRRRRRRRRIKELNYIQERNFLNKSLPLSFLTLDCKVSFFPIKTLKGGFCCGQIDIAGL